MRITVDGQRVEIATGERIEPKFWDPDEGRAKGRTPGIEEVNSNLSHGFLLNGEGRMTSSVDQSGRNATSSVYSNFKTANGVLLPLGEILTSGTEKNIIRYQSFEINPALAANSWTKP